MRLGEDLGQGDSTYRAHEDSLLGMEHDKDLISESDGEGWYQSEKDGGYNVNRHEVVKEDDDLSDISENSQDDYDESEGDDPNGSPNKKKKGEKKKKRRKKREEAEALEKEKAAETNAKEKKAETKGKPIIDAYKELAKDTKEKHDKPAAKPQAPAKKAEPVAKEKKASTQIKVNIQTKQGGKDQGTNKNRNNQG